MDLLNEAPAAFAGPELQELIDELPEEPIVPAGSSGTLPDRVTTLSSPGGGSEEQKGETATATSKRPTLQNQNQQQTALTLRTNNAMQQQQPKQGWTTRHANARRRSMPSDTLTWERLFQQRLSDERRGHWPGGASPRSLQEERSSLPPRISQNSLSPKAGNLSVFSSAEEISDLEEYDEELDKQVQEEVERQLPSSISDMSAAERSPVQKVCMLYNPVSGHRSGRKVARKASRMMQKHGVVVERVKLIEKGHAERLCEISNFDAYDVIVAVGGDGTFHECVNGMMKRVLQHGLTPLPLGLIAAGTGNSFLHELGCLKPKTAVQHILRGIHYPIDICKLSFGDGTFCYSFNSIHWGIASKIILTAEKLRWMGHAMRYTTACFLELITGDKSQLAKVVVIDENNNRFDYDDWFVVGIANNIVTASKGMKMAPEAKIDDGLIDLLLIKSTSTLNLFDVFRRTYGGTHTELPYVYYHKARQFSISPYVETENGTIEGIEEVLDVDGELKGCTPFSCEVMQQALRVIL